MVRRTPFAVMAACVLIVAACGSTAAPSASSTATALLTASASPAGPSWTYVAFGDSWPAGEHCNGCRTFAGLWADGIERTTGRRVVFVDFTGLREPTPGREKSSATLLSSLRSSPVIEAATRSADIILIATGPNEIGPPLAQLLSGTCGGNDQLDCVRALGVLWQTNFDAILHEIEVLRAGAPTAIRLVDTDNPFVSDPSMSAGLKKDFATTTGALMFELLNKALCDNAARHHAICVDVRPILNGPTLIAPVDENSTASMQGIAGALLATGLPELR